MQSDRQERISERAYQIWLAEGHVHGHDKEHWHRAEREIAEEERKLAAAMVDRATRTPRAQSRPARSKTTEAKTAGAGAGGKSRATSAPTPRRGRGVPAGAPSS